MVPERHALTTAAPLVQFDTADVGVVNLWAMDADGNWKQSMPHTAPWDGVQREIDSCSTLGCRRAVGDEYLPLTYITVVTCAGEEGYAEVTQALCSKHTQTVTEGLMDLGFKSHNHYGTNLLDAGAECGGFGHCGMPAEYGPELVQPWAEWQPWVG